MKRDFLVASALGLTLAWFFVSCGPMAPLKNLNPNLGDQYHIVKDAINRLESECMNKHTWSLENRGKRMRTVDARKLCEGRSNMRWLFYNWTQCWNQHQEDGQLARCGPKPPLPEEE